MLKSPLKKLTNLDISKSFYFSNSYSDTTEKALHETRKIIYKVNSELSTPFFDDFVFIVPLEFYTHESLIRPQ